MDTATPEEIADTTLLLAAEAIVHDKIIAALESLAYKDPLRLYALIQTAENRARAELERYQHRTYSLMHAPVRTVSPAHYGLPQPHIPTTNTTTLVGALMTSTSNSVSGV